VWVVSCLSMHYWPLSVFLDHWHTCIRPHEPAGCVAICYARFSSRLPILETLWPRLRDHTSLTPFSQNRLVWRTGDRNVTLCERSTSMSISRRVLGIQASMSWNAVVYVLLPYRTPTFSCKTITRVRSVGTNRVSWGGRGTNCLCKNVC